MKSPRIHLLLSAFLITQLLGGWGPPGFLAQTPAYERVRENLYQGELVAFPGPWSFQLPKSTIILVRDDELEALASDPDKVLELATGRMPRRASLRQICERAKANGHRTLALAFDHFFSQYRPGQDNPRRLTPDMDEYIRCIARIGQFASKYGLGLELSLLTPLEVGQAFVASTGDSGVWMHYREGLRDPKTGAFSVQLWQQQQWANNKGVFEIRDAGVRAFAFREKAVPGTPYRAVDPRAIVEVTAGVEVEPFTNLVTRAGDYRAQRVRIFSKGNINAPDGLDRILLVQQYRTPEMDYFSEKALPFLTRLIDRYAAAGVHLNALYSDEMHIQQDWAYFNHHDHGEFALRYVSPGIAREFAARYGAEFQDFAKYLIYFTHGQEDFANDLSAKLGIMHTFGSSAEDIQRTALFRARYYQLLQNGVVDLFVQAKQYAENKMGHGLEARGHATWAESPTIDYWAVGESTGWKPQYEYTSNFVWSNTVQQAASACYDYFKWGDFLTGNGNDLAEGGWLDRNYYGLALACSTGILNEVPYSYAAHWGMPQEISRRREALVNAFGAGAQPPFAIVQEMQHREVDVLMLYPLDLVAVDERFGSWMTQYGYANYITAAKLLERGHVSGNAIAIGGRRFTTLVALFEPFPSHKLLEMMRHFVESGGRLIWSGPPPILTLEGGHALATWRDIFGVDDEPTAGDGLAVPGEVVTYEGSLAKVAPQVILTDFVIDRIYPITPRRPTQIVARVGNRVVGTIRQYPQGGQAVVLGYRPRDDQSRSLGYETRNWFEILDSVGAYPSTGRFAGVNDNTEHVSRTTAYLVCRFPNGALALAPHLCEIAEGWDGGFVRDPEADRLYLKHHPPTSETIRLQDFKVNGHALTYLGEHAVSFRLSDRQELIAFAGRRSREITVNGQKWVFADQSLEQIAWAPVPAERRVPGGAILQIMVSGQGTIHIPAHGLPSAVELIAEGATPGSRGKIVASRMEGGELVFSASGETEGRWLYVVPVRK
jgi:hypothetical protein